MTFVDDARAMLTDFGVCVTYRGCTTRGVFDESLRTDQDTSMGRDVSARVLKVMHGTIGVPVRDSEITIDGRTYRIRNRASDQGEVDGLHEFWEIAGV